MSSRSSQSLGYAVDSVELKLTVAESEHRMTLAALGIDLRAPDAAGSTTSTRRPAARRRVLALPGRLIAA